MANQEGNFGALTEAFGDLVRRFGLESVPVPGREQPTPFDRIWLPPCPAALGDPLLGPPAPTSLGTYGYLPRLPRLAVRVQTGKAYSLTLDREWTTPQAILGIKFGACPASLTDCVTVVPGETLHVPNGFTEFWVFAADSYNFYAGDNYNPNIYGYLVGYVSFLVGRHLGATPPRREPHPIARLLAIGPTHREGRYLPFIPSPNVKAVRLRFVPTHDDLIVPVRFAIAARIRPFERERMTPAAFPNIVLETPDDYGRGCDAPQYSRLPVTRSQVISSAFNEAAVADDYNVAEAIMTPMTGIVNLVDWYHVQPLYFQGEEPAVHPIDEFSTTIEAVDTDQAVPDKVLVYERTWATNVAVNTDPIPTDDLDELLIIIEYTEGAPPAPPLNEFRLYEVDETGTTRPVAFVQPQSADGQAQLFMAIGWGPGCVTNQGICDVRYAAAGAYGWNKTGHAVSVPVPKAILISAQANEETGFTVRVTGLRRRARE